MPNRLAARSATMLCVLLTLTLCLSACASAASPLVAPPFKPGAALPKPAEPRQIIAPASGDTGTVE
jgi:hypothetical protein